MIVNNSYVGWCLLGAIAIVAMLCGTCITTTKIEADNLENSIKNHEAAARQAHEEADLEMRKHIQ